MQKLYISPTRNTPEINFSPDENIFVIRGTSSPEDVRALYYPVTDYFSAFSKEILVNGNNLFTEKDPLRFKVDLKYFNSSSAKFLFDLFTELKAFTEAGVPVVIEWYYDEDDPDLKDAGSDLSAIAGIELTYIPKRD
jgi:hypothetical protein